MIVLRWIAFLPAATIVVVIAQLVFGMIAESIASIASSGATWFRYVVWWISVPFVFGCGGVIAVAVYMPFGKLCPNPKIGSTIFLTLFIFCEAIAFHGSVSEMTWPVLVIRLYADLVILCGVGAAIYGDQPGG